MNKQRGFFKRVLSMVILAGLLGCQPGANLSSFQSDPTTQPDGLAEHTLTPFQPLAEPPTPQPSPTPDQSVWIDPAVPAPLRTALEVAWPGLPLAASPETARFGWGPRPMNLAGRTVLAEQRWTLALVAPFPTIADGVTSAELRLAWQGTPPAAFAGQPLLLSADTLALLTPTWGEPAAGAVRVVPAGELLDSAWAQRPAWGIVPFESLEPRWKVLQIDRQSPLMELYDPAADPLTVSLALTAAPGDSLPAEILAAIPIANRDPNLLTTVVLTGVTALVRATAHRMETKGLLYPGEAVRDLLAAADIAHISNEVSFAENCPPPDPGSASMRFCSDPRYLELLLDLGVDVIELSGNHVNDWGTPATAFTLDLYRQAGLPYYAGGANQAEARQAVTFEHNGNRVAFIGCNPAGPNFAWATETEPGSAQCEPEWLAAEVQRLRGEGFLPIVTFQYPESYSPVPLPAQRELFGGMIAAGAVIVSGSQAHTPQGFELRPDGFIHYGPGNLFFDQMNVPGIGEKTRWEFIDRHVIYAGRHIGTELFTLMLEDWARPRLMTPEERAALLTYIFSASDW